MYELSIMIWNVVPRPVVLIVPSSTSVYAGSFITINCSIQLTAAVDSQVTVSVVWKKNDAVLQGSPHRMLLGATSTGTTSMYLAQLIFSPMQLSSDNGVYMCDVTVEAINQFVIATALRSSNISLVATGKFVLHWNLLWNKHHFLHHTHIHTQCFSSHNDSRNTTSNGNYTGCSTIRYLHFSMCCKSTRQCTATEIFQMEKWEWHNQWQWK